MADRHNWQAVADVMFSEQRPAGLDQRGHRHHRVLHGRELRAAGLQGRDTEPAPRLRHTGTVTLTLLVYRLI